MEQNEASVLVSKIDADMDAFINDFLCNRLYGIPDNSLRYRNAKQELTEMLVSYRRDRDRAVRLAKVDELEMMLLEDLIPQSLVFKIQSRINDLLLA